MTTLYRVRRAGLLMLACVVIGRDALAQTPEPISTDRPDYTESPTVVGPRVWQIESGLLVERDLLNTLTTKALSAPNVLLRLGMSNRFELRASMAGVVRTHDGRPRASWATSTSDLDVGVKYQLAHQDGLGIDVAVIPFVSFALDGASSANADPTVKRAWGRDLGATSVTGNINWAAPTTSNAERVQLLEGSLSLSRGQWSHWGAFLEAVVSDLDAPGSTPAWTANTGVTRLLGNDLQLDLHLGRALNDAAINWTIGTGLSLRFRR